MFNPFNVRSVSHVACRCTYQSCGFDTGSPVKFFESQRKQKPWWNPNGSVFQGLKWNNLKWIKLIWALKTESGWRLCTQSISSGSVGRTSLPFLDPLGAIGLSRWLGRLPNIWKPISMLLIYGDTILYLWIFCFFCSHAPSSLLLIQSSIILYIYMICMHFLPFSKSHVFMPMRSEDLEHPGACRDSGMLRPWRKEGKRETMGNPVRSAKCPEPVRTAQNRLRTGQVFFRNRSATSFYHQDWYCITCITNYSYGGYGWSWLSPQDCGVSTLTIWIMIKWNRRNHTVKLTMAMQGLSYCSHQTGHRVGVHLLLARPSRNLMNKSIDLFLNWYHLSMFADSRVNIMSFNVSPNDMWNVF